MSTKQSKGTADTSFDASLFVGDDIHEREIELPDGKKYTFHFKELSAVDFRRFGLAEGSADEDKRAVAVAKLIAYSVVTPDGKPAMNEQQASRLKPAPAGALFNAILEINASGDKGNESTETNGSGT